MCMVYEGVTWFAPHGAAVGFESDPLPRGLAPASAADAFPSAALGLLADGRSPRARRRFAAPVSHFARRADRAFRGSPMNAGAERPMRRVETAADAVYLTFDDGPDEEWTPRILDLLAAAQASATFFAIGRQAERSAALLRRVQQGGPRHRQSWLRAPSPVDGQRGAGASRSPARR